MNKILIVEDDPAMTLLLKEFMCDEDATLDFCETGYEALESVKQNFPDVAIVDIGLPDISGLDLIRDLHGISQNTEVIILTGQDDAESAMSAIQYGARDYLTKPVGKERLLVTIKNAIDRANLSREVRKIKSAEQDQQNFYNLIGVSGGMKDVFKAIDMSGQSDENVIILGEQGSGKMLVAQTIHQISARQSRPFKALNCAIIDEELIKEEFDRVFNDAENGTLYLSYICSLPIEDQKYLYSKLDSAPDLRLICSVSEKPIEAIKQGKLLESLFYRVSILPIDVPPLRQRGKDIQLLATHFLHKYASGLNKDFKNLGESAVSLIEEYHWPGNVRELENTIKSIVTLNDSTDTITAKMFPRKLLDISLQAANTNEEHVQSQSWDKIFTNTKIYPIRDLEQMAIEHALKICDGNVQEAALRLKISPSTLYRKKPAS